MKNADLPAMPNDTDVDTLNIVHKISNFNDFLKFRTGLTKREMFAMSAMQGICSNPDDRYTYEQLAGHAVKHADALLAELEKTNEKQ